MLRPVPEAVSTGPAGGQPLPQLPPGRADHAVIQLHPRVPPSPPQHLPSPIMAGLGPSCGPHHGAAPCTAGGWRPGV